MIRVRWRKARDKVEPSGLFRRGLCQILSRLLQQRRPADQPTNHRLSVRLGGNPQILRATREAGPPKRLRGSGHIHNVYMKRLKWRRVRVRVCVWGVEVGIRATCSLTFKQIHHGGSEALRDRELLPPPRQVTHSHAR